MSRAARKILLARLLDKLLHYGSIASPSGGRVIGYLLLAAQGIWWTLEIKKKIERKRRSKREESRFLLQSFFGPNAKCVCRDWHLQLGHVSRAVWLMQKISENYVGLSKKGKLDCFGPFHLLAMLQMCSVDFEEWRRSGREVKELANRPQLLGLVLLCSIDLPRVVGMSIRPSESVYWTGRRTDGRWVKPS